MLIGIGQGKKAKCQAKILFDILDDNLKDALCTEIVFFADGKKHTFGAWGDHGETCENVTYYLDEQEYHDLAEFKNKVCLCGSRLIDFQQPIVITECDGCYPDSTPRLKQYIMT